VWGTSKNPSGASLTGGVLVKVEEGSALGAIGRPADQGSSGQRPAGANMLAALDRLHRKAAMRRKDKGALHPGFICKSEGAAATERSGN
jgi:hypothetical protein